MENKKESVVVNLIWRFAERSGAQLVAFVVSVVLARILEPDAYGTVALMTVFITIMQVFVDSGLGNALIQKKDADELDFSTVFWANIFFCTILYIGTFFAAPFIARFYNDSSMTPYIRVLGFTILISGVKNVQQAYVSKHLMFKKFFIATLGGTIVAAVVGITIALKGGGVWALVAQQVVNTLIDTIVLWIMVKWRPQFRFSMLRLKRLFSYGWKLLVSSLIDVVYNDLRQLIIGKMYSSEDLAYYNQGKKFPQFIVTNINTSIDSVLLPVMSEAQDKPEQVKMMTRRALITSVYIMAPFMIGLAFMAEPVICLLLTEKWLLSVPFLRIFCITYMFRPVHTANLNAIKALGRSDLFLKMEIMKKVIGLVVLVIAMPYGVMAMAYSLLINTLISQIINAWPNKKFLNYGYIEQVKDFMPSILLAIAMGCCIYPISALNMPDIIIITIQVFIGAVIYIVASIVLKIEAFQYVWEIVKKLLNKFLKK